jgi:hypothetical protein
VNAKERGTYSAPACGKLSLDASLQTPFYNYGEGLQEQRLEMVRHHGLGLPFEDRIVAFED